MDVKVARGPRIRAPQEQPPTWETIGKPYSAAELVAAGVFVSDLGKEPAQLQCMLERHRPAVAKESNVEKRAEDTAQGVVAAERTLHSATRARGAVTAAARVLLHGEAVEDVVSGGAHNVSTSAKVIAGLGVAGGVVQSAQGVHQIFSGKVGEGAVNVAAGGLTTGAGAIELSAPAAVARKFVPVLAGAAGIVEGVGDVVQAVQEDDTEKVVVGSLKTAGGAMLAAAPWVGGTVFGAPAAVVLGVVGGGVLGGAEIYEAIQHFSSK